MRTTPTPVAIAVVLMVTTWFAAATVELAAQTPRAGNGPRVAPQSPDPESLGVSLKNVRRQMAMPVKAPGGTDLRFNFQVEVLGKEPRIEFFKEFNLSKDSGVEYGAPTHQEILNTVTPMGFRNYGGFDLLSLRKKKK